MLFPDGNFCVSCREELRPPAGRSQVSTIVRTSVLLWFRICSLRLGSIKLRSLRPVSPFRAQVVYSLSARTGIGDESAKGSGRNSSELAT